MKYWLHKSGWRLLPGLLAASLTLVAAKIGILQPLENSVYCALFRVKGERSWDERVVVIEIDKASLAAIGQFPWPRYYYAQLLEQITPANPSVIAFDILFAEPSGDDGELARAMARHGNVVLATAWDEQRGVIGPNASVVEGAISTGHIHHHGDANSITRSYESKVNGTPALSIESVQRYRQQHSMLLPVGDLNSTLWLNWPGATQNALRYSFADVLTGKVPPEVLTQKLVFIGFTGEALDPMITPYDSNPPAAGVYQHVVAANNLLAQNHLQPFPWPLELTVLLLSSGLLGYGLSYRRFRVQLLTSMTMIILWGGAVIFAFCQNYWLPSVVPWLSVVMTSVFVRMTQGLQMQGMFQTLIVPPAPGCPNILDSMVCQSSILPGMPALAPHPRD